MRGIQSFLLFVWAVLVWLALAGVRLDVLVAAAFACAWVSAGGLALELLRA